VIVYVARRRYPRNTLLQKIHIPLFLGGLNYLPPATGTTYGSWAIVGLVFGILVRKHLYAWWYKYNFVLSAALDSSVSAAGVVIFFAIFYSGASPHFTWWGTKVYKVSRVFFLDIDLKFSGCLILTMIRIRAIGKDVPIYSSRRVASLREVRRIQMRC
jgi:hypothetical protein